MGGLFSPDFDKMVEERWEGVGCYYEVIKREDLIAAFEEALRRALIEILARIDTLIDYFVQIEVKALWKFELRNRLDYDYLF